MLNDFSALYKNQQLEEIHTDKVLAKHYIGDRIVINGESYTVTGNYPRHGYLFGMPNKISRGQRSVKIIYGEPVK
ncbi:hypothetical protein [Gynuella sunshinyii]|uniref:Uncharacterized protein n=1 Tax=Gynuella sunshinyii YC6258 TaxID=1445510 RepID=A0A0C5VRJ3_9GAMM|nr:hypothetical protein [Gynuella sunshinyii]AJQ92884.1 hypothetical Protein YC6258_00834 [Gynuella sunshinyii YC6258]